MTAPDDSQDMPTVEKFMGYREDRKGQEGREDKDEDASPSSEEAPLDPDLLLDLGNLVNHGRNAFTKVNYELAMKCFKAALILDPDNRVASFFATKAEYMLKAARSYDRMFELTPSVERQRYAPSKDIITCPKCDGDALCTYCKGKGSCPSCGGTGWRSLLQKECSVCRGTGICDLCNESKRCMVCEGRGVVKKNDVRVTRD